MSCIIYTEDFPRYAYDSLKDFVLHRPKTDEAHAATYWDNENRIEELVKILSYNHYYRERMKELSAGEFTLQALSEVPLLKSSAIPTMLKNKVVNCKKFMGGYTIERIPATSTLVVGYKMYRGIEGLKKRDGLKGAVRSICQLFPCFTSEDFANESRYYRNYWFCGDNPIKWKIVESLREMECGCRLSESLPLEVLPMIYYVDGSATMLIAYDEHEHRVVIQR